MSGRTSGHQVTKSLKDGCLPCAVGKQPFIPLISLGKTWTLNWWWWWWWWDRSGGAIEALLPVAEAWSCSLQTILEGYVFQCCHLFTSFTLFASSTKIANLIYTILFPDNSISMFSFINTQFLQMCCELVTIHLLCWYQIKKVKSYFLLAAGQLACCSSAWVSAMHNILANLC